jgi:hypothetical protein
MLIDSSDDEPGPGDSDLGLSNWAFYAFLPSVLVSVCLHPSCEYHNMVKMPYSIDLCDYHKMVQMQ